MNPPPTNIGLLTSIANETGHPYADAYAVWLLCYQHEEPYLIVDTVLWIAKRHTISVIDALELYQEVEDQFG